MGQAEGLLIGLARTSQSYVKNCIESGQSIRSIYNLASF
jgi:hypothetical protein